MRAEIFASARLLLSLVDFGNHGFCLQRGRRETARRWENGPGLKHFSKSATAFGGQNPISQIHSEDADSDFGRFGLHMSENLRTDFKPLGKQFFVTETAQHAMQRAKSSKVKFVGPMLRLMRSFGRIGYLIADVRAEPEADFISQNKILTGYD